MAFSAEQKRKHRMKAEVREHTSANGIAPTELSAPSTNASIDMGSRAADQQLQPRHHQQLIRAICSMLALPRMSQGPSYSLCQSGFCRPAC
jgi:hypothetical protein